MSYNRTQTLNKLEDLYSILKSNKLTWRNFEEFEGKFAYEAGYQEKVYDILSKNDLYRGTANEFYSLYGNAFQEDLQEDYDSAMNISFQQWKDLQKPEYKKGPSLTKIIDWWNYDVDLNQDGAEAQQYKDDLYGETLYDNYIKWQESFNPNAITEYQERETNVDEHIKALIRKDQFYLPDGTMIDQYVDSDNQEGYLDDFIASYKDNYPDHYKRITEDYNYKKERSIIDEDTDAIAEYYGVRVDDDFIENYKAGNIELTEAQNKDEGYTSLIKAIDNINVDASKNQAKMNELGLLLENARKDNNQGKIEEYQYEISRLTAKGITPPESSGVPTIDQVIATSFDSKKSSLSDKEKEIIEAVGKIKIKDDVNSYSSNYSGLVYLGPSNMDGNYNIKTTWNNKYYTDEEINRFIRNKLRNYTPGFDKEDIKSIFSDDMMNSNDEDDFRKWFTTNSQNIGNVEMRFETYYDIKTGEFVTKSRGDYHAQIYGAQGGYEKGWQQTVVQNYRAYKNQQFANQIEVYSNIQLASKMEAVSDAFDGLDRLDPLMEELDELAKGFKDGSIEKTKTNVERYNFLIGASKEYTEYAEKAKKLGTDEFFNQVDGYIELVDDVQDYKAMELRLFNTEGFGKDLKEKIDEQERQDRWYEENGFWGQVAETGEILWNVGMNLVQGVGDLLISVQEMAGNISSNDAALLSDNMHGIFDDYIEATVYSKPLTDPETGEWNMDRLWASSIRTIGDMAAMVVGGGKFKAVLQPLAKNLVKKAAKRGVIKKGSKAYNRSLKTGDFVTTAFASSAASIPVILPGKMEEALANINKDFSAEDALTYAYQSTLVEAAIEALNPDFKFVSKSIDTLRKTKKVWKPGELIKAFKNEWKRGLQQSLTGISKEILEEYLQNMSSGSINQSYNHIYDTDFHVPKGEEYAETALLTTIATAAMRGFSGNLFRPDNSSLLAMAADNPILFMQELDKNFKNGEINEKQYKKIKNQLDNYLLIKEDLGDDVWFNKDGSVKMSRTQAAEYVSAISKRNKIQSLMRDKPELKNELEKELEKAEQDIKNISNTIKSSNSAYQAYKKSVEIDKLEKKLKDETIGSKRKKEIKKELEKLNKEKKDLDAFTPEYSINGKVYNNKKDFLKAIRKYKYSGQLKKGTILDIKVKNDIEAKIEGYMALGKYAPPSARKGAGRVVMNKRQAADAEAYIDGRSEQEIREELKKELEKRNEKQNKNKVQDLKNALKYFYLKQEGYEFGTKGFLVKDADINTTMNDLLLESNISFAEKFMEKFTGKKDNTKVYKTEEEYNAAMKEMGYDKRGALSTLKNTVDGFFDSETGVMHINKQGAKRMGALSVGSHELLHAIMFKRLKDSKGRMTKEGLTLINSFINLLKKQNPKALKLIEQRLDSQYNRQTEPFENYAEEYLNIFHDLAAKDIIKFNEGLWVKIGELIRTFLRKIGFRAEFKNGRDVYDFLKGYTEDVKSGKLRERTVKMGKESLRSIEEIRREEIGIDADTETDEKSTIDEEVKQEEDTELLEELGVEAKEKPRYQDKQVPVKREEFTVYNEDGTVHGIFRATTNLDGTVTWKQQVEGTWVSYDGFGNFKGTAEEILQQTFAAKGRTGWQGSTYKAGKVESYDTVMNPKMWDRLTADQQQRIDPKRAKKKKKVSIKTMITRADRKKLSDLGYAKEDIRKMKPEEAGRILEKGAQKKDIETEVKEVNNQLEKIRKQQDSIADQIQDKISERKNTRLNIIKRRQLRKEIDALKIEWQDLGFEVDKLYDKYKDLTGEEPPLLFSKSDAKFTPEQKQDLFSITDKQVVEALSMFGVDDFDTLNKEQQKEAWDSLTDKNKLLVGYTLGPTWKPWIASKADLKYGNMGSLWTEKRDEFLDRITQGIEQEDNGLPFLVRTWDPSKAKLTTHIFGNLERRMPHTARSISGFGEVVPDNYLDPGVSEEIEAEKESIRKLLGIEKGSDVYNKVLSSVMKTFGTRLPSVKSTQFKNALKKAFEAELTKTMQGMMGTKEGLNKFLTDHFETIFEVVEKETWVQIERLVKDPTKRIFTEVEIESMTRRQTKEAIKQGRVPPNTNLDAGNILWKFKQPTLQQFIDFYTDPSIGASTKSDRKTRLAKILAVEFGFDATMEVVQTPEIMEKRRSLNELLGEEVFENEIELISKEIGRDRNLQFSKTSPTEYNYLMTKLKEKVQDKGYLEVINYKKNTLKNVKLKLEFDSNIGKKVIDDLIEQWEKGNLVDNEGKKIINKIISKEEKRASLKFEDILSNSVNNWNIDGLKAGTVKDPDYDILLDLFGKLHKVEVKSSKNSQFKSKEAKFNIDTGELTSEWYDEKSIDVLAPEFLNAVEEYFDTANDLIDELNEEIGYKKYEKLKTNEDPMPDSVYEELKERKFQRDLDRASTVEADQDIIVELENEFDVYSVQIANQWFALGQDKMFNGKLPPLKASVKVRTPIKRGSKTGYYVNGNWVFLKKPKKGKEGEKEREYNNKIKENYTGETFRIPRLRTVASIDKLESTSDYNLDNKQSIQKLMFSKSMDPARKVYDMSPPRVEIEKAQILDKAISFSRTINDPKGITVLDFDDTLATTKSLVKFTAPDGTTGTLNAEQYASTYEDLLMQGYKFDFSEFNKVVDAKLAPLFQKALKLQKKFGTENMFVLTARPPEAQKAIFDYLSANGLNVPLKNITGLGDSTAGAKALWIADKVGQGYNDFYFADDALQNVQAVANMLDQFDVKSKVQQAKLSFSKSMDEEFNKILEETMSIGAAKRFSEAQAKLNRKQGKWTYVIPPSAQDFVGLLYNFLSKGNLGEKQMKFFQEAVIDPFARAYNEINTTKQIAVDSYRELIKRLPEAALLLKEEVAGTNFTNEHAIRVYLWTKAGYTTPFLSRNDQRQLYRTVENNHQLKAFADGISLISKKPNGYTKPGNYWLVENIKSDLFNDSNLGDRRAEILAEWIQNKNEMFSKENLNKIEVLYGENFREALEDILYRMEHGTNRPSGKNRLMNKYMNWVNGSVGAIMFFNMRSAVLQTISAVNYINWTDNSILKASAAFANQKQFWEDFTMIFNSDMLKQRRGGLKYNVNEAELAEAVKDSKNPAKAAIAWLLKKGFLPTQIADSFAISAGGATFYRNRVKSLMEQGMTRKQAKEQAWIDFQETTETAQQSSRPDLISQQQANPLGRLILAFANTPLQYMRIMNKAVRDLVAGRGDARTHVSKIVYYGVIQSFIFNALQSAIWAAEDDDEEELDKKQNRIIHGMLDGWLVGFGYGGRAVSQVKNTVLEYQKQRAKDLDKDFMSRSDHTYTILQALNFSPPIGSKFRKLYSAIQTEKFNRDIIMERGFSLDNPLWAVIGNTVEAATNIPLGRLSNKMLNVDNAFDSNNEYWQRIALIMGWNTWDLGIQDPDIEGLRGEIKERKKLEKKETKRIKKETKDKEIEDKFQKEQDQERKQNKKEIKCSAVVNGKRCRNKVVGNSTKCTIHEKVEQRSDGEKKQCRKIKSNGDKCKMKTANKSGYCYYHD